MSINACIYTIYADGVRAEGLSYSEFAMSSAAFLVLCLTSGLGGRSVDGDDLTKASIEAKKANRKVGGHCSSRALSRAFECGRRGNVLWQMR